MEGLVIVIVMAIVIVTETPVSLHFGHSLPRFVKVRLEGMVNLLGERILLNSPFDRLRAGGLTPRSPHLDLLI